MAMTPVFARHPIRLLVIALLIGASLSGCGMRIEVVADDPPQSLAAFNDSCQGLITRLVDQQGRLDADSLLASESELDRLIVAIGQLDEPDAGPERIVYRLNAYHLVVIKSVIVNGLPRDLGSALAYGAVFDRTSCRLGGERTTPAAYAARIVADGADPRLRAALSELTVDGPRLRWWQAATLDADLDQAMRELAPPRGLDHAGRLLLLAPTIGRHRDDFPATDQELLLLLDGYLSEPLPAGYQIGYASADLRVRYRL
ncbi:MAG: DUF547 domain-containing protein [Planctomycetota bacterium]|nr:DUF547 domain-containing protein [Planctomycetota bacterium]